MSQMRILLEIVLPLRDYDIEDALCLVEWIQMKNYRAYLSHRERKMRADG
jgi:hypothetical protein